jgi:Rrf2 family protein
MAASCRFAFAVHILAVLALKRGGGVTSELLAGSVNTNPVVIRRILSELRKAGLVCCAKGAGGGATLCLSAEKVSLAAIFRAVEPGAGFSAHPQSPNKRCPVGRQIEVVLDDVFSSAQRALEAELARRSLAEVVAAMAEETPPPRSRSRKAA